MKTAEQYTEMAQASLDRGEIERAQVYATLAQASATDDLARMKASEMGWDRA